MDYVGQKYCELYYYIIMLIFAVFSWLYGYYHQQFYLTVKGWAIGTVVALIISIPDWPMYNRNKIVWADEVDGGSNKAASKSKK